jgi:hypothetical protein
VALNTNVPMPFLMMDGEVLEASTVEIVAVAPVPRALTVIVALLVQFAIVIVCVLALTTIQLAADDVPESPKMKLPRDRLLSSVTVRVAVMSLANVAVPLTPPAIELPSQLLPLLQRPLASTFQLPGVCAKAGPATRTENSAPARVAARRSRR